MNNIIYCPRCHIVEVNDRPELRPCALARLLAIACKTPKEITSFKEELCPNCSGRD